MSWELQELPMNNKFKLTEETVEDINESRKHIILGVNSLLGYKNGINIPVLIKKYPKGIDVRNKYALYFKNSGKLAYYGPNLLDTIDRLKNVKLMDEDDKIIEEIVEDKKIIGGKRKTRRKKSRKNRRKSNQRYR